PKTLSITIDKPRPYFLGKLTYPTSFVVAKESVSADRGIMSIKEMVGTGPFVASEYRDGQIFRMTSFRDYHGGAPQIDGIDRPVMKDAASRFNAYKRGELDLLALERQDVKAVNDDPELKSQLK